MESNIQVQFSPPKIDSLRTVQLVPAPQYTQYMQQQQQQQPAPVPLIPLEEEQVVDLQSSQMEEDEKLARQLQAQFNQQ